MDELVDILNSDGDYTGEQIMKSEAHKKGLYHPTVHIWFYTSDGKVLIQKRSSDKKNLSPAMGRFCCWSYKCRREYNRSSPEGKLMKKLG